MAAIVDHPPDVRRSPLALSGANHQCLCTSNAVTVRRYWTANRAKPAFATIYTGSQNLYTGFWKSNRQMCVCFDTLSIGFEVVPRAKQRSQRTPRECRCAACAVCLESTIYGVKRESVFTLLKRLNPLIPHSLPLPRQSACAAWITIRLRESTRAFSVARSLCAHRSRSTV